MIDVKFTPKGVIVKISKQAPHGILYEQIILAKPQAIEKLIEQLQEAKVCLVEHQARSAEEGQHQLWESI